ncbi:type II toxin-antitoxin system HipA family toxin [Duganella sp. PWIR1]
MEAKVAARALDVWVNETLAGTWTVTAVGDRFHYAATWLDNPDACPLSLSLPLTSSTPSRSGETVRNFFENLLPDSTEIRERLARRYCAKSTNAFDLLEMIGGDCAGAVQVLPSGSKHAAPSPTDGAPLNDAEVASVLRDVVATTAPGPACDLRVALAGAQEKTALLRHDGEWCLPIGAAPTTHIFKLPMGLVGNMRLDLSESVNNEWLCSIILKAFGMPVADCTPLKFEDQSVLAVERFDRSWMERGTRLVRLHQEDMCQALGLPPSKKYESDGGPGTDRILELLDGSVDPDRDKRTFFQAQVLFWMLCAPDGHAKNFSVRLRAGGKYELAPMYDVLSAHPLLGNGPNQMSRFKVKLAMAIRSTNVHWRMRDIRRRHWVTLGERHAVRAVDGRSAAAVLDDLVEQTPSVVQKVRAQLPAGFPEALASSILEGLEDAARRLSA